MGGSLCLGLLGDETLVDVGDHTYSMEEERLPGAEDSEEGMVTVYTPSDIKLSCYHYHQLLYAYHN